MDIALSSYSSQFEPSASVESARQRQQQQAQRQSGSANQRSPNKQSQSRAEANQRTPAPVRIINGEVISSETTRVASQESNQTVLTRQSANYQPNQQPATRRISPQQALQNFQDNEEMVPGENQQRQVSGIIDEFV